MPDDQVRVYRASELGGCVKSQVAAKLDYQKLDTPTKMLDIYEAGNQAEIIVGQLLRARGYNLFDAQMEVELVVTPRVSIVGHIDWRTDGLVVECKSMSEARYIEWLKTGWHTPGLVQKYKWQLSAYMNALEVPADLVVFNRDAKDDDPNRMVIERVPEPFFTTGEIKERVLRIDRFVRLGELPVACDVKIWPCPFAYLEEVEYDEDNFEVEGIATSYKAAMLSEKVGKEAKLALRKLLDEATKAKSYKSERVTVTYYDRRNPSRWDEEKIRSAGINPDDLKTAGGVVSQVRVTIHEEGDRDSTDAS